MDANEVIKKIQFYSKGQPVEIEFTNADGTTSTSQIHAIRCSGGSIVLHGCQNNSGYNHMMKRLSDFIYNDNEAVDDA